MVLAVSALECISFGIYTATFLWFGLQNIARANPDAFTGLMRLGPMLGIALGTGIFALIGSTWLLYGRFELADMPPSSQVAAAVLLAVWLSNMIFEVWTLDPVRKSASTADSFQSAVIRARRHLLLHCALVAALWMPWLAATVL